MLALQGIQRPSFQQGIARSKGESLYPHLWDGLILCLVPSVGPQGLYPHYLRDWSPYGNDAQFNSAMTGSSWQMSERGWVLDFPSVLEMPMPATTKGASSATQKATWMGWVKPAALDAFAPVIESRHASQLIGLFFSGAAGNPITACWTATGGEFSAATGLDVTVGEWTFVAATVDGGTITVYRASKTKPMATFAISLTPTDKDMTGVWSINQDGPAGGDYTGSKDDIRMYNRPLSYSEIMQSYMGASPLTPRRLIVSVQGATNAEVTPAAIVGTGTVPAVTVTAVKNVNITPAAIAGTGTVPAGTVAGDANVSPDAVVGSGTIPAPTVSGEAVVTPAAITGTGTVPAPTVRGEAIVSPSAIAGQGTVPAPTITTVRHVTISASAIVGTGTVPAVTVDVDGAEGGRTTTLTGRLSDLRLLNGALRDFSAIVGAV